MPLLSLSVRRRLKRPLRLAIRRLRRHLLPAGPQSVVLVFDPPATETTRSPRQLYGWAVAKTAFAP